MREWHSINKKQLFLWLKTTMNGLTETEAIERLKKHGRNELTQKKSFSALNLFLSQFKDFLVLILIFAAIISLFLGFLSGDQNNFLDAGLILIIVILNAVIGFLQEYKAEKSIEALKKMSSPTAKVLRNGKTLVLPAKLVVPGDIIFLENGDRVPADSRLIESLNLKCNESMLTGESLPVEKTAMVLPEKTVLSERKNMVYMNSFVTYGKAKAVVVVTGMNTEVGKIAESLISTKETETIFQKEVKQLGKTIGLAIGLIILFVALTEFFVTKGSFKDIFLRSVSLAVAAVPEGLPAVVTISLMIGAVNIARKNALARKLPVIEMLGSVSVICTDKTGTLTENKMVVQKYFYDNKIRSINEKCREKELFLCGVLCNDSLIGEKQKFLGDPTETALLVSAEKQGLNVKKLVETKKLLEEKPFSSTTKIMAVAVELNGKKMVFVKGAPEVVLKKCSFIKTSSKKTVLDKTTKKLILNKNKELAKEALRVIGFAFKPYNKREDLLSNLTFLGLQGMLDPPRQEVKKAIMDCRMAGIRVVMLTGDNPVTALAIGKKLGFTARKAFTGAELKKMSDQQVYSALSETDVFARMIPEQKVRILKLLQGKGERVAMTGDGVNDAPALKASDVGVAMGIRGTDVSKQTADLILLDDNFKTIRDAIKEGRGIFDNIRKFVNYLLSANLAEVLIVLFYTVLEVFYFNSYKGLPVLLAIHLLWLNLLTDGLPALALGLDRPAKNVMNRKPLKKGEGIINNKMKYSIVSTGFILSLTLLGVFSLHLLFFKDFERARTLIFTALVASEILRGQIVRKSFGQKFFSNKWFWAAGFTSILLQLLVLYTPAAKFFRVVPLTMFDWIAIISAIMVFALLSIVYNALEKKLVK